MKKLYLIRHAKSSWEDPSLSDFARPLNSRGLKDAPLMAGLLKRKEILPDKIISSPAKRALSTAKIIAEELHFPLKDILKEESIYQGGINELTELVCKLDNQWTTVFVFGHNPGLSYLAEYLSGEHYGNIPTCGITAIEFNVDQWQEVSRSSGTNIFYEYPKKHS